MYNTRETDWPHRLIPITQPHQPGNLVLDNHPTGSAHRRHVLTQGNTVFPAETPTPVQDGCLPSVLPGWYMQGTSRRSRRSQLVTPV
ncbi:hypothetical protein N7449_001144 [Penicillium cf. viridicatum]|uniref:Uncharacterized protein n=1 Tax=Penicillium cf. viridicatum TaxID=2972119 RepID=A0A9W9N6B3_9EURO|nr:hypothetical protein N7449_001144 [Penicillium cf. viridicatum]